MPSITSNSHYTTIGGQIYSRGTSFYPTFYQQNFVRIATQNYQMLRQILRAQKEVSFVKQKSIRQNYNFILF